MENKDLSNILGCRPFNVPAYLTLLKSVSTKCKNLTEIQKELGWAQPTVSEKVKLLRERGIVCIVFAGRYRYVTLTMKGKEILEEVGE